MTRPREASGRGAESCERGPLPEAEALRITAAIAEALAAAHALGIVRCDVKPQNVLLAGDGRTKLTDFGLAKLADDSLTRTGMIMGTVSYMAPEQLRDSKRVGPPADIYGLGCTLYYLLTARTVFPGRENEQIIGQLNEARRDVRELTRDTSPGTAALVAAMLVKNPEERIGNTAELLARLRPLASG